MLSGQVTEPARSRQWTNHFRSESILAQWEVLAIKDKDNHAAKEPEQENGFKPRAYEGYPRLVVLRKSFEGNPPTDPLQ